MSKFEEICAAFDESQKKFIAYRDHCHKFARDFGMRFIRYLEVPEENVEWFNPDAVEPPKGRVTIPGAMYLDDDTFWHFGVRITIFDKQKSDFRPQIEIVFMVRRQSDGDFQVSVKHIDKIHDIQPDKDASYTVFFNAVHKIILALYQDDLENFLASQQSVRRIGFI
ncbi:hypothetical protein CFY86_29060 [Raoultella ornithinolytica]|uniref:Uncharacterized protein n=1 Tax=Raoultella ornithinolytica TaxID=54291 RepID=A0A855ETE6_RAOOR|nr:hypothetical protein [Raoultella ornithinolytica]QJK23430.1 hypothetical protein HJX28_15885 [Klebsiella pneumoniae]PIK80774.1 hypothetical protein CFY86_29060 [Raoultella ornithinolytica]HBS9329747.1 hypothetical protein [Klebsiella pneumoniae]HBS9341669.1 hypothetical protein [Klebsiella pneumoniae]HCM1639081.1 hypothetical protein [Klebsiella pneumoniae]